MDPARIHPWLEYPESGFLPGTVQTEFPATLSATGSGHLQPWLETGLFPATHCPASGRRSDRTPGPRETGVRCRRDQPPTVSACAGAALGTVSVSAPVVRVLVPGPPEVADPTAASLGVGRFILDTGDEVGECLVLAQAVSDLVAAAWQPHGCSGQSQRGFLWRSSRLPGFRWQCVRKPLICTTEIFSVTELSSGNLTRGRRSSPGTGRVDRG